MAKYKHVFSNEYPVEASQDEEVSEFENNSSYNESKSSDDNCSVGTNLIVTGEIISKDGAVVWNLNPIQNN